MKSLKKMLALLPEYVDPYNKLPKMEYYQEYLNRLQKGENVNSIINQIKNGDIDILNTFLPKPVKWDNGTIPKNRI